MDNQSITITRKLDNAVATAQRLINGVKSGLKSSPTPTERQHYAARLEEAAVALEQVRIELRTSVLMS